MYCRWKTLPSATSSSPTVRTTSLPRTLPSERYYTLGLSTATTVPNQGKVLRKITQPSRIIRFFHQGGHKKGISTFGSYGVAPLSTNLVKCTSKGRGLLPILTPHKSFSPGDTWQCLETCHDCKWRAAAMGILDCTGQPPATKNYPSCHEKLRSSALYLCLLPRPPP